MSSCFFLISIALLSIIVEGIISLRNSNWGYFFTICAIKISFMLLPVSLYISVLRRSLDAPSYDNTVSFCTNISCNYAKCICTVAMAIKKVASAPHICMSLSSLIMRLMRASGSMVVPAVSALAFSIGAEFSHLQ